MNRSGSYDVTPRGRSEERGSSRPRGEALAGTADVWLMNAIAISLGLAALGLFVVGMIVGTGVTSSTRTTAQNFEYGSVWLLGSIVLAIAGLTFRREHHIPDAREVEPRR